MKPENEAGDGLAQIAQSLQGLHAKVDSLSAAAQASAAAAGAKAGADAGAKSGAVSGGLVAAAITAGVALAKAKLGL